MSKSAFFLSPAIRVSGSKSIGATIKASTGKLPVAVKAARTERESAFDEMFEHAVRAANLFSKSTFENEAEAGRRFKVLLSENRAEMKRRVVE